jgi:cytochrome c biogenesis protein CcmG/thiol:disulfide interchange protein DsbE
MAGRAKLFLQAAAVTVVALLVALLGWQVVAEGKARNLRDAVWDGETPAAPAFELARLDGSGTVSLASLRGKAVVVNFWASWCEPCKEESPRLEQAWERFRERDVVVLGIDTHDFKSEARRFVERYELSYPMLHDKGGATYKRYGLVGLPETMFIDGDGEIVAWVQGPLSEADLDRNIALALEGAS